MINKTAFVSTGAAIAALVSLAPLAHADQPIDIERNRVVPVILDDNLSVNHSHRGDRFSATVENDYDLPGGSRLMGRVTNVHKRTDVQPPYIDVEFYQLRLPDGTREDVKAQPVSMDGGIVKRDRWGHYHASRNVYSRDQTVIGGAVVGLVLGSLIHRPVEGAIIGGLAGVIVGMDQQNLADNATMPRGTRMGALFQKAVHLTYNDSWRGDRYANDGREDDRWRNRDGYDQNQNDRYSDSDTDRDNGYGNDRYDRDGQGGRNVRVSYRGTPLRFASDERPYWEGHTLMVPLTRTADQLDLSVDSYRSDDTIIVQDDDSNLRLEQGSRTYRLNGRYRTMAHEVSVRNGVTYVPIDVLAEMKREPVLVNGSRVLVD